MTKYYIDRSKKLFRINKNIYGHFAEHIGKMIYDGIWVGKGSPIPNIEGVRKDVIDALKHIHVPIIRWPGGAFADMYNWKDAVGFERRGIVNRNWGHVLEDNSFGTHEFLNFCEELGCGAYLSGNLGTGSIREMVEWIEYITDNVDSPMSLLRKQNGRERPWHLEAFGIGNEVWGCGGQMLPEYYAMQYRQAAHFIRTVGQGEPGLEGNKMKIIASGPNGDSYDYMKRFLPAITGGYSLNEAMQGVQADGISFHYYSFSDFPRDIRKKGQNKLSMLSPAEKFNEAAWYDLLGQAAKIDMMITEYDKIMSGYDPGKRVGLIIDEWGAWHAPESCGSVSTLYQQNTMRDAILAALSLNIFNKHADRVHMSTIAQMVNVLQAIILTKGDKILFTPTYHVYDMYKGHQGSWLLYSEIENHTIGSEDYDLKNIYESVSDDDNGNLLCTLCNTSIDRSENIEARIHAAVIEDIKAQILTGDAHACNSFKEPDNIKIKDWKVETIKNDFSCYIPAGSVVSIKIRVRK